jgi:cyclopropane fatty-acyl-phospholipid synthase-like methyltransferase
MMDRSYGYEGIAAAFLAGRGGPATAAVGATAVRAWARALPPEATVLDVGCGSGIPITQVLIEEGLDVYAVDASPSLTAAFRDHFPDTPIACEAVEDSRFFNRSFDAIVAWGLVFLLPADTQVDLLRRLAAVLTSGGRLLFTSPSQVCMWTDVMTGRQSQSLGAKVYRETLVAAGLSDIREYDDEGQNHYYDAGNPASTNSGATAAV